MANDAPPRLFVDDNANFLEAARFLLDQEGLEIVGVAACCAEAVMQAQRLSRIWR